MLNAVAVAVFGALGALARWGTSKWVQPSDAALPWGTLAVNGLGSLALGLLTGWCLSVEGLDPRWRLALGTGLLGSFTTFSTFSNETFNMFADGAMLPALMNIATNVLLGLGAVWLGQSLAFTLGR